MRILLQGYYGRSNFGDDLLLSVAIDYLRQTFPSCEIRVLVHDAGIDSLSDALGIDRTFCIPTSSNKDISSAIKWADALICGGGTCLHDSGFCGYWRNVAARFFNCKVVWLAIGVDEIRRLRSRCRARVSVFACDLMIVRDQKSLLMVKDIYPNFKNVFIAEDLVWLYDFSLPIESQGRELLISWRDFTKQLNPIDLNVLIEEVSGFTQLSIESGLFDSVSIINLAGDVDYLANKQLHEAVQLKLRLVGMSDRVSYTEFPTMSEALSLLERGAFLISGRMHPFLASKLLGIPSVPVAYALKVMTYAGYFSNQSVLDIRCGVSGIDSKNIYELVREQMLNPSQLIEPADELTRKARLNFSELKKCLLIK